MEGTRATLRLDKWLWQARLFRTRSLAARQVAEGRVRVNGARVTKPAAAVAPGDTLTVARAGQVLVLRVLALGERRGPPVEAQRLYADVTPGAEPPLPQGSALD